LYESSIIVEYLNDQYNLDLVPKDPYERAKGKLVLDIINKKIIPAYFRAVQAQEPDKQTAGREEFIAALKEFAEKLPKNDGPFYGGKTFGFVDIELTPWILRLVTETMELIGGRLYILEKHRGLKLPTTGEPWKRFGEWADAVKKRDSVWKTRSEDQYYEQVSLRVLALLMLDLLAISQ
jgi:glutathione S-transferase